MNYFTSDWHLGHKNIISFCDRPFRYTDVMNQALVDNFNQAVLPDDTVYFLGDMSFLKGHETEFWLNKLVRCRKVIVLGNHDPSARMVCLNWGFDVAADTMFVPLGPFLAQLHHFPPAGVCNHTDRRFSNLPPEPQDGRVLLHGHTHDKSRGCGRRVHIGVDAWDFKPVSESAVLEQLAVQGVKP